VRQYQKLFSLEDIQLQFLPEAIDFIAEKALEYKLGARGLRSLCEAILTDAMFDLPMSKKDSKTLVIDRAYAEEKLEHSRVGRLKAA
jgi:ATP-dependent Clp protease ATP-binding subunit ClpX